ncbi:MAG: glycoside hydrolase family 13 protein [Lacisediminihabitans sp.]
MLQPHHDGSPLYVSTQAPVLGEVVRVQVRIPQCFGAITAVRTRSNPDHEPLFSDAVLVASTPVTSASGWDWWQADIEVENRVQGYRFLISLEGGQQLWLNATGLHDIETLDSEDFTLVAYDAPPEWVPSTVLYQIFPDRFGRSAAADARPLPGWAIPAEWSDEVDLRPPARSQQFYGGDLDGVIEHLDHIVRLGVTMIYLTPVFPGGSNHRYDASSFGEVDPLLGGDAALIRLVEAAHARGLKVIGDLTSNHSGDRHEWFVAAYQHPEAPESAFYYWLDETNETYAAWLSVSSLPKFNWNSRELRRRFIEGPDSVVAKWLKAPYNLDGWRIDVANMTGRYREDDLNSEVRRTIRRTMAEINPDTILFGESTNDASKDFQGDAWHGAMTYAHFTRPLWGWLSEPGSASSYFGLPFGTIPVYTGGQFFQTYQALTAGFPWRTRLGTMNALDTHDTPRFLTHALPGVVPVAFGMSVTLPGIPVVFAGDEFGLVGEDGEQSRTPMPWSAVDAAADSIDLYARLIHLRTEHPALNSGGMRWLHVGDDVLVYIRESADESVLVVAARADFDVTLPVGAAPSPEPVALRKGTQGALFGDAAFEPTADGIRLAGHGPSFTAWELPGASAPPVGGAA